MYSWTNYEKPDTKPSERTERERASDGTAHLARSEKPVIPKKNTIICLPTFDIPADPLLLGCRVSGGLGIPLHAEASDPSRGQVT